jgi:hypothetical protein
MPYKVKVTLLAIGTVLGLAGGLRHMAHKHRHHRADAEQRMTEICAEAARQICPTAEAPAAPDVAPESPDDPTEPKP